MSDTSEIIKAINKMHESVNDSFKRVYTEIGGCDKRVTEIEKALAIKKALYEEKKEAETDKKNLWQPAIRTISIAGFLALLALAWAKIKAVLDLVQ